MSDSPPKKLKLKTPSPVEYARYLGRIRAEAEVKYQEAVPEISDQGILIGQWQPRDRDGDSLGKTFNVFAAPQDLRERLSEITMIEKKTFKYVDAVKRIAGLKNWYGHNGANYANDKELYEALKNGSYDGGWIIPTCDILIGKARDGKTTTPDNLYAHKDKGALAGTFRTVAAGGSDYSHWYWTCTESPVLSSITYYICFLEGSGGLEHKDREQLSCRPVRLVEVPCP